MVTASGNHREIESYLWMLCFGSACELFALIFPCVTTYDDDKQSRMTSQNFPCGECGKHFITTLGWRGRRAQSCDSDIVYFLNLY